MRLIPLLLLLCLNLGACQQAKLAIEDDPTEQAKAQAAASRYFESFVSGDRETVLKLSAVPFWGDGERIDAMEQLTAEVTRQLDYADSSAPDVQVEATHFMTLAQTQVVLPELYARLQASGFDQDEMYVVALRVRFEQHEEQGIILVRQDAEGLWKVTGIGD